MGYVGVAGLGPRLIISVGGFVAVNAFAGDNRFKSVRVGGGALEIGDGTPSVIISILIGRPSKRPLSIKSNGA